MIRDLPLCCLDGNIPLALSTCSLDGVPNVNWLSQVVRIDERHVAVPYHGSCQTGENLAANPRAQLLAVDATTQWQIDLRLVPDHRAGTGTHVFEVLAVASSSTGLVPGRCGEVNGADKAVTHVRYDAEDDSIFVNDNYIIRGVAGRILWLLLTVHRTTGRSIFSNRELRRHAQLKLPASKDNLETRLLGLQRRLDDKAAAFRLLRHKRGVLRLLCETQLDLAQTTYIDHNR
jgi:hypothetical protein